MASKYNKNDRPLKKLEDLFNELNYSQFPYKKHFIHLCNITPDAENEKLEIKSLGNDKKINDKGVVYVFVIGKKIFKIGSSTVSIKERIGSYNSGKILYRGAGTNSTTNYFVLQSFIKIGKVVKVYAYFPNKKHYTIFGEKGVEAFPPAKKIEKKILTDLKKKYDRLPIGCSQK